MSIRERKANPGATLVGLFVASIVPAGWWATYDLFAETFWAYTLVSGLAFVGFIFAITTLGRNFVRSIHLWIFLIVFTIGYFVKFYVLAYLVGRSNVDLLRTVFGTVSYRGISSGEFLDAYWFVTLALGSVSICLAVITRWFGAKAWTRGTRRDNKVDPKCGRTSRAQLLVFLGLGIVVSVATAILQANTGIGVASSGEAGLPYRLAGVLQHMRRDFVPILFLLLLVAADRSEDRMVSMLGVVAYLVHAGTSSILSTSREHFILAIVSLGVFWVVSGQCSRRRSQLLLALVPVTAVFNEVLSLSRAIRSAGEVGAIAAATSSASALGEFGALQEIPVHLALSSMLRVNGIDSLLQIMNFEPRLSFDRMWSILSWPMADINQIYATEVLGYGELIGVAYSTSLLGFFYFVSGSRALAIIGLIGYLSLWHLIFRVAAAQRVTTSSVLLAMLAPTLVKYTSEGSLQALPFHLLVLIGIAMVSEWVSRMVLGTRQLRPKLSYSTMSSRSVAQ